MHKRINYKQEQGGEGLTLEASAFQIRYGSLFTFINFKLIINLSVSLVRRTTVSLETNLFNFVNLTKEACFKLFIKHNGQRFIRFPNTEKR